MKSTTTVSIGLFLLTFGLVADCAIAARIRGASRDESHLEITAPNHDSSRRLRRENPKQYYYRRYLKEEKSSSPSPLPTKGLPEVESRLEEKSSSPSPLPTKGVVSFGSTSSGSGADKLDKLDKLEKEDKFEEDVEDKEEKEDDKDVMEVSFDDEFEMEGNATEIFGDEYETARNTTGTNATTTVDEEAAFGFFTRIGSRTNYRLRVDTVSNKNANMVVPKLTRGIGQLPSQAKVATKSTKANKKSKSEDPKRSKRSKDDSSPHKSENKLVKAR